jgi:Flp pilus assembly pilin Flp
MVGNLARVQCWICGRLATLLHGDRGAVSTETAIITALVAVAALALATFIAGNVAGWQAEIPTP